MDPLTQGVVGAALPQAALKRHQMFFAGLLGLVGGMAPDLDILIRSSNDPLLYLEYHRQFTHSLIFIPIGGLICAALLNFLLGRYLTLSFKLIYLICTLGYATHGLLDAATSYGTMLFWPFSDVRVAWSYISSIDPLFTIPALTLIILSAWRGRFIYARLALVWGLAYIGIGAYQNHTATQMGYALAKERGHSPIELSVKPSFGNLLVWKVFYHNGNRSYVDAVRAGWNPTFYEGESIERLNIGRDFPWLNLESQQARDIERFHTFSKGFIAKDPLNENRIIDLRYSMVPNQIDPLWSIELSPQATQEQHVDFVTTRNVGVEEREALWKMITEPVATGE